MPNTQDIAIIGSGIIGALAAAYLGRMLPSKFYNITFFKTEDRTENNEVIYSSLHSDVRRLNRLLKLSEAKFVSHCDGVFSLGEKTIHGEENYLNTYCPYGLTIEGLSFVTAMQKSAAPHSLKEWEDYNLPAKMMRQNKFLPPDSKGRPIISDYSYGYQIDIGKYTDLLIHSAKNFGVKLVATKELKFTPENNGSYAIETDGIVQPLPLLIINCNDKSSETPVLKAKSLELGRSPQTPLGFSNHVQHECSEVSIISTFTLQSKTKTITSPLTQTEDALQSAPSWNQNVVNLPDGNALLPLMGAPFRLNQLALERLIDLFPTTKQATSEREEYNLVMSRMQSCFIDFQSIWLHKSQSGHNKPSKLTAAALRKAHLFEACGRLAMNDDDNLFEDHWTSVLLGQGYWPKREPALADNVPLETIHKFKQELKHLVDQALVNMPTTSEFIMKNCPSSSYFEKASPIG